MTNTGVSIQLDQAYHLRLPSVPAARIRLVGVGDYPGGMRYRFLMDEIDNPPGGEASFRFVPDTHLPDSSPQTWSPSGFENKTFHIVNATNGFTLRTNTATGASGKGRVVVEDANALYQANASNAANGDSTDQMWVGAHKWRVEAVAGATNAIRIFNVNSNEYLGRYTTGFLTMYTYEEAIGANKDQTIFTLVNGHTHKLGDDDHLEGAQVGVGNLESQVAIMRDRIAKERQEFDSSTPASLDEASAKRGGHATRWKATDFAVLPHFMISDSRYSSVQSQNWFSPYYFLVRSERWEPGDNGRRAKGTRTMSFTRQIGTSSASESQVETSLSMTVSASGGFSFRGVGAELSASVTGALRVQNTQSQTRFETQTHTVSYTFEVTKDVWYHTYLRHSRYTLYRLDFSQVGAPLEVVSEADEPLVLVWPSDEQSNIREGIAGQPDHSPSPGPTPGQTIG